MSKTDVKSTKRKSNSSKKQTDHKEIKKKSRKEKNKDEFMAVPPEIGSEAQTDRESKKRKRDITGGDSTNENSKKKKKKEKEKYKKEKRSSELEIDITAPEPLSKKALRLQKKNRIAPPSSSKYPSDSVEDTANPGNRTLVKEVKGAEFSVWVGNLSYETDSNGLTAWLCQGDMAITKADITRMNIPKTADGHSRGFAYIDLVNKEVMERIISRSEQVLDGRHLLIKDGKSFEGRPVKKTQRYHNKSFKPGVKVSDARTTSSTRTEGG